MKENRLFLVSGLNRSSVNDVIDGFLKTKIEFCSSCIVIAEKRSKKVVKPLETREYRFEIENSIVKRPEDSNRHMINDSLIEPRTIHSIYRDLRPVSKKKFIQPRTLLKKRPSYRTASGIRG